MQSLNEFAQREHQTIQAFVTWYQKQNQIEPAAFPLNPVTDDPAYWQTLFRDFKTSNGLDDTTWSETSQFLAIQALPQTEQPAPNVGTND